MKVLRKMERTVTSVNEYQIGDQIFVGKYTATCQKVEDAGAIFLLDQYLDKPYRMNQKNTNRGGYETSDLRTKLNKDIMSDHEFDAIRENLIPFENGDLVRIPTVGEFFGVDSFYDMDDAEQWELMKKRSNRIAEREGDPYEWGWLQNTVRTSAAGFAAVGFSGVAYDYYA